MEKETHPPSAPSTSVLPLPIWSPEDLYQTPEDRTPWLVHNLIPAVGTSIIGAPAKAGKSVMTRQLCAFVSQGRPFLGREVRQGQSLYVSTQETRGKIAQHFRELGGDKETTPFVSASGRIEPRGALDRVSATLGQYPEIKLVVLDMIADLLPLHDTNDYGEMNKTFGQLRNLAEKHQIHVCVTHHSKKSETENAAHAFIGSSAIAGSVDQLLRLHVKEPLKIAEL